MSFFRALSRIIFGLTFILSGFFKLVDPIGTGLIVEEYFSIFHLGFMDSLALYFGIFLSSIEFIIGINTLLGLRMKITSVVGLIFIGGFTIITAYLVIFNPISDCGCFGEAIHLTNMQTFLKNIVLLLCSLLLFFQRKKYVPIVPVTAEWCLMTLFWAAALFLAFSAFLTLPRIDFTAYKVGTDLNALHSMEEAQYETIFVYRKDGKEQNFALDDLPDSTWTFVDSQTELISGSTTTAQVDLTLRDSLGDYKTDMLYNTEKLVAAIVWKPEKMTQSNWERIEKLSDELQTIGLPLFIFSSSEQIPQNLKDITYLADYKSLITLNRSNGGAVYFAKGVIAHKWANRHLDNLNIAKVLSQDPEIITVEEHIDEQLFICVLILGTILFLVLMRYFCRLFYSHEKYRVKSAQRNIRRVAKRKQKEQERIAMSSQRKTS